MSARKTLLFKVVVLGESGVGKTSLLVRYVQNSFTIATKSTIGSDFLSKDVTVDGKPATLQIWDTAGQERYQGLGTSFYRGADGVIFVFDVTRKNTFEELAQWKKAFLIQIGQEGNDEFPMLILANKVDRENERQVTKQEVKDWCGKQNLTFYETSAKEAVNVDKAFETIAKIILTKTPEENIKFNTSLNLEKDTKKSPCC